MTSQSKSEIEARLQKIAALKAKGLDGPTIAMRLGLTRGAVVRLLKRVREEGIQP